MSKYKRLICFAFPVALVMALVLGLTFMHIGRGSEIAFARSKVYVGSGSTYNLGSGTISGDIDVAGGTLNMTGGTVTGSINLNGTMKINSSAVINGTVNYQNTSSYITLTSSLTRTISVKTSSTASGTRVAYSATASYLTTSRFSVTNLPSNMKLAIESNYIVIRPNTFTVTIIAGSGGTVNSTSSITLNNVAAGTAITESSNTLKIGETTITATANSGYKFSYWSYSGSTVTSDMTIYAYFSETSCTVRFSAGSGGSVSRPSISGIPNGTRMTISGNTITINGITVTATPDKGYQFDRWSTSASTITSSTTITAYFKSIPTGGGSGSPDVLMVGLDEGKVLSAYERALIMLLKQVFVDGDTSCINLDHFMELYYEASIISCGDFVNNWGIQNHVFFWVERFTNRNDFLGFETETPWGREQGFDIYFPYTVFYENGTGYTDSLGKLFQIEYPFAVLNYGEMDYQIVPTSPIPDYLVFTEFFIESFDGFEDNPPRVGIIYPETGVGIGNTTTLRVERFMEIMSSVYGWDFIVADYEGIENIERFLTAFYSIVDDGVDMFIFPQEIFEGFRGNASAEAILDEIKNNFMYMNFFSDLVKKSAFVDQIYDPTYLYNVMLLNIEKLQNKFGDRVGSVDDLYNYLMQFLQEEIIDGQGSLIPSWSEDFKRWLAEHGFDTGD